MANATYTTYEAKARFSEVMRKVRHGATITVTYRGRPAAEIRPVRPATDRDWMHDRLEELVRRGVVTPATEYRPLEPIERGNPSPGAVARFLAERWEDD